MSQFRSRDQLVFLASCLSLLFGCTQQRGTTDDPGSGNGRDGGRSRDGGGCEGLACQVANCTAGTDTIVAGTVTAPNGADPIRQAIIYVPQSGSAQEFPPKVACEVCDNPVGGRPVTQTISNIDGTFELRHVPVTDSTPIVIQKGRWRKVVRLSVARCQRHELTADQGRLPRNHTEGDMPRMAVAVGDYDAIECVLKNVGVDPAEFTSPAQPGVVHLYDNQVAGGQGAPDHVNISQLMTSLDKMLQYNLIFLNCSDVTNSEPLLQQAAIKKNIVDYVSQGGRLYTTDWSYDWIEQPPAFSPFICYNDDKPCTDTNPHGFQAATSLGRGADPTPFTAQVDQSTEAGRSLMEWLTKLPVPIPGGMVHIEDLLPDWVLMRQTAMDMSKYPSTTWLTGTVRGMRRPMTVTFDYPVSPPACGKVLYSSYHTREHTGADHFPLYCPGGTMIAQEHVLEYLIFEISSCIGPLG